MTTNSRHRTFDVLGGEPQAHSAFGELVRRYQDAAFGAAYAILRDRAAAEDATQAAFLSAWLRKDDLREPRAFGSWLRAIVRTECFRILRRNRIVTVPLEEIPPVPVHPASDRLVEADRQRVVSEAISTLSEADRTVIVLRYVSDLSYQEMSAFLDIPISTVKKRLHDARKRLLTWFTYTTEERARSVLRDYRPSRDARLERRVMDLTAFLDTVIHGDVTGVAAALETQPELASAHGECRPLFGFASALWVAAVSGQAEMVQLLIARGARLESGNPVDMSPLTAAAIEGHAHVVKILLDAGAEIDIFAACAMGDAPRAAALLAENPTLARACTADGKTPLHFCRSVEVAATLLGAGARADLETIDDSGLTPLQWIALTGRYRHLCRYLIAQGASAEVSDIFSACLFSNLAAVKGFLDEDVRLVDARLTARRGIPRAWIGGTPLHVASMLGEQEIVALLLRYGADVNALGGEHRITPLHCAAASGHVDVSRDLVAVGADVRARDAAVNATPEEWARRWGHDELASLLKLRSS